MFIENKQTVADAICEALKTTSMFGDPEGNGLNRLVYLRNDGKGNEVLRPIFADGTGENGYYDIVVNCDSGAAMFLDVASQFVRKMM